MHSFLVGTLIHDIQPYIISSILQKHTLPLSLKSKNFKHVSNHFNVIVTKSQQKSPAKQQFCKGGVTNLCHYWMTQYIEMGFNTLTLWRKPINVNWKIWPKELTTQIGMKQLFSLLDFSQGPEMPGKRHKELGCRMRGLFFQTFLCINTRLLYWKNVVFWLFEQRQGWKQLQVYQNHFKLPILRPLDHSHQIFGSFDHSYPSLYELKKWNVKDRCFIKFEICTYHWYL